MSIRITVQCDALDCFSEAGSDIDGGEVSVPYKWGEHDGYHYCQACWPAAQKEIVAAGKEAQG